MEFKVSVIIPVYNAAPFVRQAVESALAQPETAEVVLVEDNSPDNSLEICQQLALEYPQVLLFRHPNGENRGAGPSRNLGISKSTQPYIAFLDADDFYLPARFSAAQAVFEQHSDCDGVYDAVGMYYEDEASRERWREHSIAGEGITTVEVGVGPADLFSVLIKGGRGHVHLNGLVIRRKVLAKASLMDETIADTLHEDTDWVLRLAAVGQLYAGSVTEPTSMRRVHQQNRVSAPRSAESIQRDRMRLRRATYEWISRHGTTAQRELAFRRLLNQYMKWPVVRTNRGKLARLLGFPFTFPKAFFERSYWSECKDAFSTMLRENWARKP